MDCLFCRIVAGEIPASMVRETEDAIVVRDVNPQAPVHVLVIPRRHFTDVAEAVTEDERLVGRINRLAVDVAAAEGLEKNGYRIVVNAGRDGGQTVFHLHIHVLGGRPMTWPPG
jgi:histidine triad (HIT) family protein